MENITSEERSGSAIPSEVQSRTHCSRLKRHLLNRNIYFEERSLGNNIVVIDIKTGRESGSTKSFPGKRS